MTAPVTFTPYRESGGDIQQRYGTPGGFVWQTITSRMAWGILMDLWSEAEAADQSGDTVHAKRLARDADCLIRAISDADNWRRASAPMAEIVRLPSTPRPRLHSVEGAA